MKNNLLLIIFFSFITSLAFNSAKTTIEFKVTGNCNMCKKNIEASLKGVDGVKSAIWNKDTKTIKVTFDSSKIKEEEIHKKIANAGYDTDKVKASDEAYNSLHGCCQYERKLHK